jgi:hypothetical protein
MQLLPNEQRLVSSNEDKIVLTNQRLHLCDKEWGRSYQVTMFLENIRSVERLYKSNPILLVIAIACAVIGFFSSFQAAPSIFQSNHQYWIFAVGILFLAGWLMSRHQVVTFIS